MDHRRKKVDSVSLVDVVCIYFIITVELICLARGGYDHYSTVEVERRLFIVSFSRKGLGLVVFTSVESLNENFRGDSNLSYLDSRFNGICVDRQDSKKVAIGQLERNVKVAREKQQNN